MSTQSTYKHGTRLKARTGFVFKNPATRRNVTIKDGELLWVSNTTVDQAKHGAANLARINRTAGDGWYFTLESIAYMFEVQP